MTIKIVKETFYVLTGALIIFTAMELILPGVVLAYININIILLFWILNGIIILLTDKNEHERKT